MNNSATETPSMARLAGSRIRPYRSVAGMSRKALPQTIATLGLKNIDAMSHIT